MENTIVTHKIEAAEFVRVIGEGLERCGVMPDEQAWEIQDELAKGVQKPFGLTAISYVEKETIEKAIKLYFDHLKEYRYLESTNLRGKRVRGWHKIENIKNYNNQEDIDNIIWSNFGY